MNPLSGGRLRFAYGFRGRVAGRRYLVFRLGTRGDHGGFQRRARHTRPDRVRGRLISELFSCRLARVFNLLGRRVGRVDGACAHQPAGVGLRLRRVEGCLQHGFRHQSRGRGACLFVLVGVISRRVFAGLERGLMDGPFGFDLRIRAAGGRLERLEALDNVFRGFRGRAGEPRVAGVGELIFDGFAVCREGFPCHLRAGDGGFTGGRLLFGLIFGGSFRGVDRFFSGDHRGTFLVRRTRSRRRRQDAN